MGRIVICGAGVIGLATAMMLARDGHDVTVLEADAAAVPEPAAAWEDWSRGGVAQFRQPHILLARFRHVCDQELPGMTGRLLAAGCSWVNYLDTLPPTLTDTAPRPGDKTLRLVTGRRPVVEAVFAAAARDEPGVTVHRGVRIGGLLAGRAAVPNTVHVAGVHTTTGERIRADLVVDATGRRSPSTDWLAELGAPAPCSESSDVGFVYYTRFLTGPDRPPLRTPALTPMGTISILTIYGDNETWSVTLYGRSADAPIKALRRLECFDRVLRACPLHAHWLDGRPICGVLPMAGVLDRYRRFAVAGRPIVTGFAAVGDAWACTNPSAGRGLSVGMVHAQLLRRVVGEHLAHPGELAMAWDEQTESDIVPFVRNQQAADRARLAEMTAIAAGIPPPRPDPLTAGFLAAAAVDADAFRGLLETLLCTAQPQQVLARPRIKAAISAADHTTPPPVPGPDRTQLLTLLAG
jgi:2-polyprenyl-6-methoxyphenol hydroxylase-like FAD-dependent oxidoreductase